MNRRELIIEIKKRIKRKKIEKIKINRIKKKKKEIK